ncbi:hypothetical protein [Paenisporosarcina sp. TG20]|uniref:hypothetical protein n=1 Tax=Paenisporosarcina sp. TG20 TaxID=1211706 RepID=UPI0002FA3A16|nr:hypothetical protein [Paenisporosarcina sp. TG20]
MNKVELKKNFALCYEEILFSANNNETKIWIKNDYSVPSSTVTSTIFKISGKLYEEKKWGYIFSDLIEIESDINELVKIDLNRFEIDDEDFETAFLDHLKSEATDKMMFSDDYYTVLKKMVVL